MLRLPLATHLIEIMVKHAAFLNHARKHEANTPTIDMMHLITALHVTSTIKVSEWFKREK